MKVEGLDAVVSQALSPRPVAAERTGFDEFASWLEGQIQVLDAELKGAETSLRSFAVGQTQSIHHVMIALEKARLSFDLAVQVRNKALEAYQEIMRMQV